LQPAAKLADADNSLAVQRVSDFDFDAIILLSDILPFLLTNIFQLAPNSPILEITTVINYQQGYYIREEAKKSHKLQDAAKLRTMRKAAPE
jgi:hypothetical protein